MGYAWTQSDDPKHLIKGHEVLVLHVKHSIYVPSLEQGVSNP